MSDDKILSRQEQAVAIRCESCHGAADAYAATATGTAHDGSTAELALDSHGNTLAHVVKEGDDFFLYSRLTGQRHYVPQTLDTVFDNGKQNPLTGEDVYSPKASFAMGRDDGNPATGIGPRQQGSLSLYSHTDSMDCASCHASWTNNCVGCHLWGEYDTGNNFSNITGERIVFEEDEADFVYQSPVFFQLGVSPENKISPISPNTETFFRYEDLNNDISQIFHFSDRNGGGSNTARATYPSLAHNVMMPHSIRGRVDDNNEGPRYCTACHLTDDGLANFGTEYDTFRTAMANNDFAALDFNLLQEHIGQNPNNQLDSPLWVHMVAGLGSGLLLFDENGCPVNPLDDDTERKGCDFVSPQDRFANTGFGTVALNLDRMVDENGNSTGSNNHPMDPDFLGPNRRDGSLNPNLSGPLGATLIQRLTDPTTGIVLDSWLDADGEPQGNASVFLGPELRSAAAR